MTIAIASDKVQVVVFLKPKNVYGKGECKLRLEDSNGVRYTNDQYAAIASEENDVCIIVCDAFNNEYKVTIKERMQLLRECDGETVYPSGQALFRAAFLPEFKFLTLQRYFAFKNGAWKND